MARSYDVRVIADLRDAARRRIGRVTIDSAQRPVRVRIESGPRAGEHVYVDWEGALDDASHLRRCISCGGPLYRAKRLPQVTPFLSGLLVVAVAVAALGHSTSAWLVAGIVALALVDLAILMLARPRLVCYACGSAYGRTSIARYIRRWDSRTARAARPRDAAQASSGSST
jgi:hypothetical protein